MTHPCELEGDPERTELDASKITAQDRDRFWLRTVCETRRMAFRDGLFHATLLVNLMWIMAAAIWRATR